MDELTRQAFVRRVATTPATAELAALYGLLGEAVPLALERLEEGGVPLSQQWAFWEAFHDVSAWVRDTADVLEPDACAENPFQAVGNDCLGELK